MRVAIEGITEGDTVVIDHSLAIGIGCDNVGLRKLGNVHREGLLEPSAKAKHLEATRVSEGRARPVHEPPESPRLVDEFRTRS